MNIIIENGAKSDVDQIAQLYDDLNDFLKSGINYPGWKKGIYPNREDAEAGVAKRTLYVAKIAEKIVGSIILNHEPEPAYSKTSWKHKNADYSSIFVVHTFAVHPSHLKNGLGRYGLHHFKLYEKVL
ncbi:acetyltransferase (GNAT) family protein [Alkalibaculum bacchi]|uniref:Acetyltransferase (GNAT) family protein n=1 Tax=Alkalibaculum bacchi TaxID=645887 RepID=A0A366IC17_9FIRM|nr:GNAT family N-acetyltransferase [Alkalibaculum bacchi]RBP68315.1 acetyltransferase (GNAT) family protein [Alkalibaculum bacchi]